MKLLDLYCGAGGSSMGAFQAGFQDITGIDNVKQPRYPFKFVQMDALEFLSLRGHEFDVIIASPPCKLHTMMMTIRTDTNIQRAKHQNLIPPTRNMLRSLGKPYIIENVLRGVLENPIMLCGTMFGLKVLRHRFFETNLPIRQPVHFKHQGTINDGTYMGVYGNGGAMWVDGKEGIERRKGSRLLKDWKVGMGIDWMQKPELAQAIPPAYYKYLLENSGLDIPPKIGYDSTT